MPYSIIKDTFDNGKVKIKYFYSDSSDKNNYVEITYYRSGYISEEKSKLDTLFHGPYKVYWDKPGKVIYYETLNDHQAKISFEKGYDSIGRLMQYDSLFKSCKMETFKCDAIVNVFFSNGKLKKKYQRLNGVKNGLYIDYYENGNLNSIGNYTNDKENGIFKFFDEIGKYRQTMTAVDGKREGVADVIYENGVHGFGQFHNDKEDGIWLMKDTLTNKIIDTIIYRKGIQTN